MNKRIQKLAIQAGLYVDLNGEPWPKNMNGEDIEGAYERFAELIIKECAKQVHHIRKQGGPTWGEVIEAHFNDKDR